MLKGEIPVSSLVGAREISCMMVFLGSRDVRIMQLRFRILFVYFTGLIYFKSDLENVLLLLYNTLL